MPGLFFFDSQPPLFHDLPHEGIALLGRSPQCEVFLPDLRVSRTHAILEISQGQVMLCDQSQNGTQVNGRSVKRQILRPHDKIKIGRFCMEYHLSKPFDAVPSTHHTKVEKEYPMVGRSRLFLEAIHQGRLAAQHDYPILICGETGTGKEVIAHDLVAHSRRSDLPVFSLNCASLTPTLAESELFGHERGAFTGALEKSVGVFEAADSGTLFLDEIGELPLELQAKLLRVLEAGKFKRLGSPHELTVRARLIFATNRNLSDEVRLGRFREDLYHRISIFTLQLPALRQRREDLDLLAAHLLARAGFSHTLSEAALDKLRNYDWPGNIRELRNLLIRTAVLKADKIIEEMDLILPMQTKQRGGSKNLARQDLRQSECEVIHKQLSQHHWHRENTALALGISRSTLFLKMKKYGLLVK